MVIRGVLCLALSLGLSPAAGTGSAVGDQRPPFHPTRLASLGDARQVVVVTSGSWSSSRAHLRAYERTAAGEWQRRLGPVVARLGRNGFARADERRQGGSTTPAGTFALSWAFGTRPDPGTALPYRVVDDNDWWPYGPRDPATYNVWQPRRAPSDRWRMSWAEDLSSYGRQYRHAVVIDYNLPAAGAAADTRRGGGIFLHINRPGATTGCVSIPQADMRAVLRWLDPAQAPVIVMAPRSAVTGM